MSDEKNENVDESFLVSTFAPDHLFDHLCFGLDIPDRLKTEIGGLRSRRRRTGRHRILKTRTRHRIVSFAIAILPLLEGCDISTIRLLRLLWNK